MSVAGFLSLATHAIEVPGLYYDELIQITPALTLMEGPLAAPATGLAGTEIELFGLHFWTMIMDYIGAVKTAAYLPVAELFGATPTPLRIFHAVVAALALVATYGFVHRLFRRAGVAALAVALLAFDPSFLFFSRVDLGPVVFMFLLKAIALWLLAVWWQTSRARFLLGAAFVAGIGVYDKANFVWIVAAVVAAGVICAPRAILQKLSPSAALAPVTFLLGCFPLVLHNLSWPPRTWKALGLVASGPEGNFAEQLRHRVDLLARLLGGDAASGWLGDASDRPDVLPAYAAGALLVIAAALLLRRLRTPEARPAGFVALIGLLILLAAAATKGGFAAHHVILTYPFPHIAVAAAIWAVADVVARASRPRSEFARAAAIALLVVPPLVAGLKTDLGVFRGLKATGGRGNFSDAIYDVERHLERKRARVVVLDWGIYHPLIALSDGRLPSEELFWGLLSGPPDLLYPAIEAPGTRFVMHTQAATNFPAPRQRFFDALRTRRRSPVLERTFATRDGQPVLEVYRAGRPHS